MHLAPALVARKRVASSQMHQIRVIFFVAAPGPPDLPFEKSEEVGAFQEQLGYSDVQRASAHAGFLDKNPLVTAWWVQCQTL